MRTGRRGDQLRKVTIQTGAAAFAEGSALITMGKTKVLCAASIEESVPKFREGSGGGWVTAEYGMLPRATATRTPREAARGKIGGRTAEIQRLIGRSLRAVTDLSRLGKRTVTVDCDVVQADGGTRTAAITGGYVALATACRWLTRRNLIETWPLRGQVAAVSVGLVQGHPALDLDYAEDSQADVDMNIVMTGDGLFVEVQGTAEQAPFGERELRQLLRLAKDGIKELLRVQQRTLAKTR
ncbi:MAG: ribonuclease PH [Deltaproteobacteria bacterium]|nr:ribonuclease PH [Deltaproteobacteria bacterium]